MKTCSRHSTPRSAQSTSRKIGPTRITFGVEPSFELTGRAGIKKPASEKPLMAIQREFDQILMGKYVPPSVVIDERLNILVFRGDTGPFLYPMPGEASFNTSEDG